MFLHEKEITIPKATDHTVLLEYFADNVLNKLSQEDTPVRFVVTKTDDSGYHCELGIMTGVGNRKEIPRHSIFQFRKREFEDTDQYNALLLVPTGIGAEIGGHSGDAGPIARLFAQSCDNLITHPNVVNASDINELPDNGLYVEGSVISRLLMGTVGLQKVRSNRVMLVIDKHEDKLFHESAINAVSAARAAMGLNCPVTVVMDDKITMRSLYSSSGRAVGRVDNFENICEVLDSYHEDYDAVAISTVIRVPQNFHVDYYLQDVINPWGGVEAMLTHAVSLLYNIPSAHSPMLESREILDLDLGVVDPRKSAEIISVTFLHSILKGLHKSPRIVDNPPLNGRGNVITAANISCLIIPEGCIGLPTLAALEQGIPVIAVRENKNRMQNRLEELPFKNGKLFVVDNYLEAVGVINALRAGVSVESVRRPLEYTKVSSYKKGIASYQKIKGIEWLDEEKKQKREAM
ncbi:MAG: DUF3326 domain-containing protein [Thermodesulfovibrionales bacterium]